MHSKRVQKVEIKHVSFPDRKPQAAASRKKKKGSAACQENWSRETLSLIQNLRQKVCLLSSILHYHQCGSLLQTQDLLQDCD